MNEVEVALFTLLAIPPSYNTKLFVAPVLPNTGVAEATVPKITSLPTALTLTLKVAAKVDVDTGVPFV